MSSSQSVSTASAADSTSSALAGRRVMVVQRVERGPAARRTDRRRQLIEPGPDSPREAWPVAREPAPEPLDHEAHGHLVPAAAASAVARARTCSSGERRRRSMPCRTGPNRTPAASSASTPTPASCRMAQPQGERSVQSKVAPLEACGTRRTVVILVDHHPVVPRHHQPEHERSGAGLAQRAVGEQAVVRHQRHRAPVVECGAERHGPAAGRPKQGVHRPRGRGRARDAAPRPPRPRSPPPRPTPAAASTARARGNGRASAAGGRPRRRACPGPRDARPSPGSGSPPRRPGPASRRSRRSPAIARPSLGIEIAARADEGGECARRCGTYRALPSAGGKSRPERPRRPSASANPRAPPGRPGRWSAARPRRSAAPRLSADQSRGRPRARARARCRAPAQCAAACQGPALVSRQRR